MFVLMLKIPNTRVSLEIPRTPDQEAQFLRELGLEKVDRKYLVQHAYAEGVIQCESDNLFLVNSRGSGNLHFTLDVDWQVVNALQDWEYKAKRQPNAVAQEVAILYNNRKLLALTNVCPTNVKVLEAYLDTKPGMRCIELELGWRTRLTWKS